MPISAISVWSCSRFFLAGFLWLYDRLAQNVDRRAATVLLVAGALNLANSALLTCLVTHGMLLSLLVITQWPSIAEHSKRSASPRGGGSARIPRRTVRGLPRGQGGVRRASLTIMIGSGLGLGVSTLLTPFIARVFDPATYGSFALVTAVTSVFVGISTFRLEVLAQKVVDDAEASALVRLGLITSCAWGILLTLVGCVAVLLWDVSAFWVSTGILVFLASLQLLGSAVLTRTRDYRRLAIVSFVQGAGLGIVQLFLGLVSASVGSLLTGFGVVRARVDSHSSPATA